MLCIALLLIGTAWTSTAEELKVLTFNVLYAFDEKSEVEKGLDWIKEQQADVVALQELVDVNAEELAAWAKHWGHEHSTILKEQGFPVGLTSDQPIEVIERRLKRMHHGYLHARTGGIDYFVVHLAPGGNRLQVRKREVEVLETVLKPALDSGKKVIVLGDFNDRSPLDITDGSRDLAVMEGFLAMGLVDTAHHYAGLNNRKPKGTCPTRIRVPDRDVATHEARIGRIDYIPVSENLKEKITRAESPRHPHLDVVSDHYPVLLELKE